MPNANNVKKFSNNNYIFELFGNMFHILVSGCQLEYIQYIPKRPQFREFEMPIGRNVMKFILCLDHGEWKLHYRNV